MTTTADGTGTLGPGTLKIGETGTEIDCSCLVNNAAIEPDVSEGDSKTMLCGTTKRSADTIDWSLSGNVDVDAGMSDGLFALTWQHVGEIVPFEFTPSTAVGTTVKGNLKLVPLRLGGDDYGEYLDSDFEFPLDNFDPTTAVTYGDDAGPVAATGASSGTPGTFTPSGATAPADIDALSSVTASPSSAWAEGEYVVLGDASNAYWDGSDWAEGKAPAAELLAKAGAGSKASA